MYTCDFRDLKNTLKYPIEEKATKEIFYQMLSAVNHLHKNKIIHRDIKLENFLIGSNLNQIKLIDFGLCKLHDSDKDKTQDFCGTVITVAPEILKQKRYDYKVDCWALGIILFELLTF